VNESEPIPGTIQENESELIPKDHTPRARKRRGRRSKNRTVQVEEEMEIESSPLEAHHGPASIDLDALLNPEEGNISVKDSSMRVPRDRATSSAEEPQPSILVAQESADGNSQRAESISGPGPADTANEGFTGATVVSRFNRLLEGMQMATMSRAEVVKMEEMLWDLKAELYAAEKRGRSA
jgi:hypothetical protein